MDGSDKQEDMQETAASQSDKYMKAATVADCVAPHFIP